MNWEQQLDILMDQAMQWGPRVLATLAILVIGWIAAGIVNSGVRRVLRRSKVDETLIGFLSSLARYAVLALVVVSALGKLGVDTTTFAAVVAAAGLAIGLALQGSLGNFAAGVMLVFFGPFKKGDFVEAGGVSGVVDAINVFQTTLLTPDNKRVIVPNGDIIAGAITNYSAMPTRRIDLVFGIGYGDDIDKARSILQRLVEEDDRILAEPATTIAVSELADSSVNFVVRPWVNAEDYWAVRFDLLENAKKAFDREGISIPFPQTDVHLHQIAS